MSNYTKATNFAVKDGLTTGDPSKRIKGTEIDTEYNAIASAISSKADANSPTLTGTPLAPTAAGGTNTTQIATTAFVNTAISGATATPTITGGTINGAVIGGTTAAAITGTTITANTGFVGNLTGNVTGNVTGTVSGNAGTVTNGVYTTNFTGSNQSIGTNGYQKLPGGLIIQWGTTSVAYNGSSTSITFPTSFPTACLNAQAISTVAASNGAAVPVITSISTTGLTIYGDYTQSTVTCDTYWLAIGY